MAIECNACGQPVHETAVRCPHCGDQTGVPVDPIAQLEVAMLPELPPPVRKPEPLPFDRVTPKPKRAPRAALPKAVARKRRRD